MAALDDNGQLLTYTIKFSVCEGFLSAFEKERMSSIWRTVSKFSASKADFTYAQSWKICYSQITCYRPVKYGLLKKPLQAKKLM